MKTGKYYFINKRIIHITFAFSLSILNVFDAGAQSYRQIDSIMRICPEKHAHSAENIAEYIAKRFSSNNARLRAAYSWTAQHISYDTDDMDRQITYRHESELVIKALKTRRAVCSGYVKTFKAIAGGLGLEVQEISGYTRQNGKIDEISHAWCAVKVGGKWKLIDPTWSAGYVDQATFHKRFNDKWFLVSPEEMIKSHIPFDPVWQFSYFPVSHSEFYAGKSADSITSRFFSFPDTVKKIGRTPENERLAAANRRIKSMGIINTATERHVEANIRIIKSIHDGENVEKYNRAVNIYNNISELYNRYIEKKGSGALKKLKEAKSSLLEALKYTGKIDATDSDMSKSVEKLNILILDLMSGVEKIINEHN